MRGWTVGRERVALRGSTRQSERVGGGPGRVREFGVDQAELGVREWTRQSERGYHVE